MSHHANDGIEAQQAQYLFTYNAAKAAWKAYTAAPSHELFEEGIRAAEAFTMARTRYINALRAIPGATPPTPPDT